MFVTTKDVFCRDKSRLVATKHLLRFFCRDKIMFAATNICCDKSFVTTKLLSQQAYSYPVFSQGTLVYAGIPHKRRVLSRQTYVCCDQHMFVMTKCWILVAAPASDTWLLCLHLHQNSSPSPLQQYRYPLSLHRDCSTLSLHQDSPPYARMALPSPCTSTCLPLPRTSPTKPSVGWAFKTPHCVPGLSPPFKPGLLSPSYMTENFLLLSTELPRTPLALHLSSAFTCSFRIWNLLSVNNTGICLTTA